MDKLSSEEQYADGSKRLTISIVYDSIKHSNSSLARRPKKQLEDSIDRALRKLKERENESDSFEGEFDGIEEEEAESKVKKVGGCSCHIESKSWKFSAISQEVDAMLSTDCFDSDCKKYGVVFSNCPSVPKYFIH